MQQKDLPDEAIARAVCVKVGDSPGVSYSDIAAKAYECGRTELAIKVSAADRSSRAGLKLVWFRVPGSNLCLLQLLDFEARSGEQVPLLLKMKRSQLALSKAVESGDTDLGESFSPAPCPFAGSMMSLTAVCVVSVHGGDLPEERDEQRRLLHDSEEPAGRSEPLQTGTPTFVSALLFLSRFVDASVFAVSSASCRNRTR